MRLLALTAFRMFAGFSQKDSAPGKPSFDFFKLSGRWQLGHTRSNRATGLPANTAGRHGAKCGPGSYGPSCILLFAVLQPGFTCLPPSGGGTNRAGTGDKRIFNHVPPKGSQRRGAIAVPCGPRRPVRRL